MKTGTFIIFMFVLIAGLGLFAGAQSSATEAKYVAKGQAMIGFSNARVISADHENAKVPERVTGSAEQLFLIKDLRKPSH